VKRSIAIGIAAIGVVTALSLVLVVTCGKKDTAAAASSAAGSGGKKGGRQVSFPVEDMRVDLRPHDLIIAAPGAIDAFEQIQVTARVAGVLDKVAFAEGQEVKKGQVLAYIDSRRYALTVSQSKAAVAKAEAAAADAEAGLKRRDAASASSPGLITGEELETYRTKLRTAEADVELNRETLSLAQLNLSDSSVRALEAGIIQTRTVETGQYVQAGTVLATLLRRDPLLLRFHVAT